MDKIKLFDHILMVGGKIMVCGNKADVKAYYDKALLKYMEGNVKLFPTFMKIIKQPSVIQSNKAYVTAKTAKLIKDFPITRNKLNKK
jgi:hypothetical protein